MRKKLGADCIQAGSELPWDLTNSSGKVLFRKGFTVHNEATLKRLLSMELFYADVGENADETAADGAGTLTAGGDNPEPVSITPASDSPFSRLDALTARLTQTFDAIADAPAACRQQIESLARDTRELYQQHPSACIAAIHFRHTQPIASLHPLYSVFLVELLANAQAFPASTRDAVACAALTANLGMYEFHNPWSDQEQPLDEFQREQLRNHPHKTVELLRACGIDDELWLRMAEHHHERKDGSGYPAGLKAGRIQEESLVINLIDRYLSFVMPRRYRKPQHPTAALKIIYEDATAHGEQLVSILIKQIGVYPPGTPVKLANGEIAVVTRHEVARAAHPHVASVARNENEYFDEPIVRDTYDEQFKVKGLYHYDPDVAPQHPATRIGRWP